MTVVHLGFGPEAGEVLGEWRGTAGLPPGFGYLVPPGEAARGGPGTPLALGTIFSSNLFAGRTPAGEPGCTAVTSFYASSTLADQSEAKRIRTATQDLARALRLGELPAVRTGHVLEWLDAIPQYTIGHAERMRRAEAALPAGLHLAGNAIGGVGVEQTIARGRRLADELAEAGQ